MIVTEGDLRVNKEKLVEVWLSFSGLLEVRSPDRMILFSKEEKDLLLEGLVPHLKDLLDNSFLQELQKSRGPGKGFRSLVEGVRDLQREWPTIDERALDFAPRLNDLVGFLFATLPLAEEEL